MKSPRMIILLLLVVLVANPPAPACAEPGAPGGEAFPALMGEAWRDYGAGRYELARMKFEKARALAPDNAEPHSGIGWCCLMEKKYGEGELAFLGALKLSPDSALAQMGLGYVYYRMERYGNAAERLEKAAAQYSLDTTLLKTLAWSYYRGGEKKKARETFGRALRLNPHAIIDSDLIDLAAAEKEWLPGLHDDIGWGFYGLGEEEAAEREFAKVLKGAPDDAAALTGMAYIRFRQKKYDECIALVTRALDREPASFPVYESVTVPGAAGTYWIVSDGVTTLAWAHYRKGDLEKAESIFRKALETRDWADAHDGLGWVLLGQKKLDEAAGEFRAALVISPTYASPRMGLGTIDAARYDESNRAWASFYTGDYRGAAGRFRSVIEKDEPYPESEKWALHNGLGWSLYHLEEYEDASESFDESIRLNPRCADSFDGLGWSFLRSGRLREAEKAFLAALGLHPDYYSSLKGLVELSRARNHRE